MSAFNVKLDDVMAWAARTGTSGELDVLARCFVLYCMEGKLSAMQEYMVMYGKDTVRVLPPTNPQ